VAPRAEQSGGRVLRPLFVVPKQGQESVWDYPRPPRLERVQKHVEIVFNDAKIVDALWSFRVLETSHPPVYYVSPESIAPNVLIPAAGSSVCEWKGEARYFDVVAGTRTAQAAAWCYWNPTYGFAELPGLWRFMPVRWTVAPSMEKPLSRSRDNSMADGSPPILSVRSKASPAVPAGKASPVLGTIFN
jgi:uncharacterized protein (DUF427 family)